jgi:gag-polypeptide of LTR copia-type
MYLNSNKVTILKSMDTLTVGKDDDRIKLRDLNARAFENLFCLIDTSNPLRLLAFQAVRSSNTAEYEDGHAENSWTVLDYKYMPKTAASLTKLHRDFYVAVMLSGQDPNVFVVKLEYQRLLMEQLGSTMTDDQFMMHIMNSLPEEYSVLVSFLGRWIGHKTNPMTLEEVRTELTEEHDPYKDRKNPGKTGSTMGLDISGEEHALGPVSYLWCVRT